MDDPRQWLQFGGQDMERVTAGLPIGQALGTSAAYHGAEGIADAAKLARQVQSGEVNPMSDEGIERALNAAMVAQMGGFAGAPARAGEAVLGSGPVRKIIAETGEYGPIQNVKIGKTTGVFRETPTHLEISSIRTPVAHRGQGGAKNVMQDILQMADKVGKPARLIASPLDKKTNINKLVDFYRKHGFELTGEKANLMGEPWMERPVVPKERAHGGEVDAALHAVRHHLAGGGFLSDLFSGPDYLSTGEAASPTNWGDPELASDFFKADKALRLAREVQGKADDVTGSIPAPRRQQAAAPAPAPAPEPDVKIPFAAPERGVSLLSSDISPESVTSLPLSYAAAPTPAPASAAIDQATGKLTARIPDEPSGTALTKQQADYITRTIAAETSGKTPEETQAIAHVILNRINSGQYGSSPEAVLFAKRQFEPWMNPAGANYPMKISPTSQRYLDAQAALEAALAGEDITGGATHFWGPKAQEALGRNPPSWSYKAPGVDIGETRFHKLERAEGGSVDDALRVVREHHADGEAVGPTAQQRLRETIANIDPERAKDQPVMDPATMGEAWDRARRNYQNFPVQEGEAVARPLELGARDVIGGAIAGGTREPGAQFRRGVADLLVGSTGLPESGTLGFGVADAPMLTGIPLTVADMARDIGQGDYTSTAMGAALPAAFYARGPLGAAGRRAVEIAKEYAKPAAAAATGVAGATVAPDEAEAAKLSKLLRVVSPEDRLMMVHNLKSHRLADVEKLGGLPVPSTAVIKPEIGFDKFGDITMVAPKEMAHPSRTNPIFAADVYSPRFPSLNDEGTKIFRGFSPSGTRLYSPLTLENVVKEMKGNVRGGEGFSYGVGNVRAGATPEFKSLEEIQNARDLIVPTEAVAKEDAAKQFSELAEKFYPYYGYGGDAWTHEKDFADMMRLAGMGQWGELRKSYKPNIPTELHEEAKSFLDHLRTMPTEYFEGKPQRAVRLDEFRGAVVPGDITGEQADILRRMGVGRLEQYDPNNSASRIEALRKFGEEQFAEGGSVEDRALMLVSRQA